MLHYKFYFLDEHGHVFRAQDGELLDDLSALETARRLSTEYTVEVWQAARQVVRVNKGGDAVLSPEWQLRRAKDRGEGAPG